jgi:hypothetical protein
MLPMPFDALAQRGGGLARVQVAVDCAPLTWSQLRRLVSPAWLALLGGDAGQWVRQHSHRWRATTQPIAMEHWLGVEVWTAPRWRGLTVDL